MSAKNILLGVVELPVGLTVDVDKFESIVNSDRRHLAAQAKLAGQGGVQVQGKVKPLRVCMFKGLGVGLELSQGENSSIIVHGERMTPALQIQAVLEQAGKAKALFEKNTHKLTDTVTFTVTLSDRLERWLDEHCNTTPVTPKGKMTAKKGLKSLDGVTATPVPTATQIATSNPLTGAGALVGK